MKKTGTFFVVAVLSLAGVLAGCQSGAWYDLAGEPPDVVPGVTPPAERIEQLRELAAAAGDRSPEQRRQVAQRLAEEIVTQKDSMLRAEIVRTLAAYPNETGLGVLRRALRDPAREVRVAACEAWGQVGTAEAVKQLGETIRRDNDVDVRLAATRALGETGQSEAADALGEALADNDPAIQYRAMVALNQVTGKSFDTIGDWKQYLKTGQPPESASDTSIADRFRQLF